MKKYALGLLLVFAFLLASLFFCAEIFEEKIGAIFKTSINETLRTEFQFEAFDLSMIRSFPYAAMRFQDVHILDLNQDTLLVAERVLFKLDMLAILQSKIKMHSAYIEKGWMKMIVDREGHKNYEILAPRSENQDEIGLTISEALVKNMSFEYYNLKNDSAVDLWTKELLLSLDISEKIKIDLLGHIRSDKVKIGENNYLVQKNVSLNSEIDYNTTTNHLAIHDGEIGIEGLLFYTNGTISFENGMEEYDLVVNNSNGTLESIFKLLPEDQIEDLKKISSSGDFDLTVFYKGQQSRKSNPVLQADLSFGRGRVHIPQLNVPLKDVSFSAKYFDRASKGLRDASIQINGFKGSLAGERLSGKFTYENFTNPSIAINATGKVPINTVFDILGIEAKNTDGNIDFKTLELNGKLSDLSNPIHQSRTVSSADIALDNISFNIKGEELLLRDGRLKGHSDYFELDGLELRTPKSVFTFKGYLKRLVPFLFAEYQRPDLQFDLAVESASCDVQEILYLTNFYEEEENNSKPDNTSDSYLGAMNGDIDIAVSRFVHDKIYGEGFKGHLSFSNNNILIRGSAKAMQGKFEIESLVNRKSSKAEVEAKVACEDVNVTEFFRQTNNFGQQTLVADHLKGDLNAQLFINAKWNEDGSFNRKALTTLGSAQITDGELINFELLNNFSSYIKIEDLKHIKFGSLENYFEINKEVIKIPAMFIQSNAANLVLSGEHAFNNAIDYNIKVNAGQILTTKLKRYDPKLNPVPDRNRGFFNLFYAVKGTMEEPSYKTAKRQVKSDLERSEYHKSQIKNKLAKIFPKSARLNLNETVNQNQNSSLRIELSKDELLDPIIGKNN